jgi:non-ribosomal peptide synthetase component E (peptide arylation enzyme)
MLSRVITPEIRSDYERQGLWVGQPYYALVEAAAAPRMDKTAIIDSRLSLSYAQLISAGRRLAVRLLELGIQPGDAVAVQAPNSALLAVCHLAINRVQGMHVPIHESWREPEVRHLLARSRARALITVDTYKSFDHLAMVDGLRPDLPDLREVLVAEWSTNNEDAIWRVDVDTAAAARLDALTADADAPRHAMISSGTTALPKISEWTDNGLHASIACNYADAVQLSSDDVICGIATASTGATGYVYGVLAPLMVGATSVLVEPWVPQRALELMTKHRATVAIAVPAQIIKMLASPALATSDLSALRVLSNGGAPLPEARAREAELRFGCKIQTMYGATDAGTPTMMALDDPDDKRVSTVGRVVSGNELRIVTEAGEVCAPGETGEVQWRGAHKTLGYLNDDAATRAAFDDEGWYHSGDLGILGADGYLRIVGRIKDMILRGGQNIFPGEIEELLARHPAIAAVAVASIPDSTLGERACAFVVLIPGQSALTLPDMVSYLASTGLAKFKRPERLVLMDELPLTAGGKVLKSTLTRLGDRGFDADATLDLRGVTAPTASA